MTAFNDISDEITVVGFSDDAQVKSLIEWAFNNSPSLRDALIDWIIDRGRTLLISFTPNMFAVPPDTSGAVLIWPDLNPDMVFDRETGRVIDTKIGEYFWSKAEFRSVIERAAIHAADGTVIYSYELKERLEKINDGTGRRLIWEVLSARRGGYLERFKPLEIGLKRVHALADAEAQHDSIERLAEFLRAQRELASRATGQKPPDELVIVDRRMDDTSGERRD